MTSATFRVVTRGLQPGHSAEIATELLARLFKCSKEQVAPLVGRRAVTVKRRLTFDAATKYAQALERCGCVCAVEEEAARPMTLSDERLHRLQPKLFDMTRWASQADRDSWVEAIRDTLVRGAHRAAVVVDAADSVVACYTNELDCVVLLQFEAGFGLVHGWQNGTRLLAVNSYVARDQGIATDLQPGPGDTGRFGNVWPLIADLLTDDQAVMAARKRAIIEAEWERTGQLGRSKLAEAGTPRDGRPLGSRQPAQAPAAEPAPAPRRFSLRRH
jgi:hypothetical protein